MRKINIAGFALLYLLAVTTIVMTIHQAYKTSPFLAGGFFLLGGLLLAPPGKIAIPKDAAGDHLGDFLAVVVSAALTYALSRYLKISAFIVSPAIGLTGALVYKKRQFPIFCGSFAGMTNPALLDVLPFVFAVMTAAGVYVLAKGVFNGYGGKLGTIAFTGCFATSLVLGHYYTTVPTYETWQMFAIIGAGALASTVTYVLNNHAGLGPVIASSLVGLAGAVLLFTGRDEVALFTPVIYGASFVGMTGKKVINNIVLIALAGVVFGFIYCFNPLCGVGGKLGATAFTAVLCLSGLQNIFTLIRIRRPVS